MFLAFPLDVNKLHGFLFIYGFCNGSFEGRGERCLLRSVCHSVKVVLVAKISQNTFFTVTFVLVTPVMMMVIMVMVQ